MKTFFETLAYIAICIICLILVIALNKWTNDSKESRCNNAGGVFVKNTTEANLSSCIMKGKQNGL